MDNIKLEVTTNEGNLILAALSKLPFEQVVDLIVKIKSQGDSQSQKAVEVVPE